jgi:hypothetical protein
MKRNRHPPEVLRINGAAFLVPAYLGLNHSFFIPSLKHKRTFAGVLQHYASEEYTLIWEERIEQGVLGIRVWRVV